MEGGPVQAREAAVPRCPKCGKDEPLRIAYGYPSHDMFEASERGELALGGCMIEADSPEWHCRRCSHEWGRVADGASGGTT